MVGSGMTEVETSSPLQPSPLRQATGAASAQTIAFGLSLLSGPLLARALGDAGRGEMAAVVVPVQLFGWIVLFGLPYASAILVDRYGRSDLLRAAWTATILMTVIGSVPLALFANELRPDLSSTSLNWFRIGLFVAPLSIPSSVSLHLRLVERGAGWGLGITKTLYLYLFTGTVVGLALVDRLTIGSAVAAWILCYLAHQLFVFAHHRALRRPTTRIEPLRSAYIAGAPFALGAMAQVLLGRVDQLVMASTVSLRDLGVYAVAATAAQVTLPLTRGIADTVFAGLLQGLADGYSMARLTFALSAVSSVLLALVAPFLIPAVFGDPFADSVPLLRLLLPGQVAFNTGLVLAQRFDALQRPGVPARALVAAAAANLVFVVPVTMHWGASGAAVLTTTCQVLFASIVFVSDRREAA
jgi:O-antigen/teichoic acid export membrane protein